MEWGCKMCSYKAGHATHSMSGQDNSAEPASLSSPFKQYTLLTQLADAEAQSKLLDDAMVINESAKPVAGSSKHPDNMDIVNGELMY